MAEGGARVTSIEAIREFRAKLVEVAELMQRALSEGDFDIQRTIGWLKHEQVAHWKRQFKKARHQLDQAKAELFRKQLEPSDMKTSAIEERKRVQMWERRMEESEQKIAHINRWVRRLEQDIVVYKGSCAPLANAIAGDVEKGIEILEILATRLDEYTSIAPADLSALVGQSDETDEEEESKEDTT